MTPLDQAHMRMEEAPEDDARRLRYYQRLVECELFMLLETEPADDRIIPAVFPVEQQQYVLVFDSEERLVSFTDKPSPFAAMSGRRLVEMLSGQGLGMAVNPEIAPSSILLPAEVVDWIAGILSEIDITETDRRPSALNAPAGLDPEMLRALDARLAGAAGMADWAGLAEMTDQQGDTALVLAFVGSRPEMQGALRQIAEDVTAFSAGNMKLDLMFLDPDDPLCTPLARAGLRFDLPAAASPGDNLPSTPPGSDPDHPPRLR